MNTVLESNIPSIDNMNKFISFISCLCILYLTSCEKPLDSINDYYPEVETVSIRFVTNVGVEIQGHIVDEGASSIIVQGVSASTSRTPQIGENQQITGADFKAIYADLIPHQAYYFRTWAANEYGLSYGNTIKLDSIPTNTFMAPCSPALNTVDLGGIVAVETYSSVSAPMQTGNMYVVQAESNSHIITYTFGEKPVSGFYGTTTDLSPEGKFVNVLFYSGSIGGIIDNNFKVHVKQTESNRWQLTICNANWHFGGGTLEFTTRFNSPL